jgi:hypothetical protein
MLSIFKNAYCFYIVQLSLNCKSEYEFNRSLDKVINSNKINEFVEGDKDLKEVFKHVCEYRSYNRCLRETKPEIPTKTVFNHASYRDLIILGTFDSDLKIGLKRLDVTLLYMGECLFNKPEIVIVYRAAHFGDGF